jgi:hypothetical protein
MPPVKIDPQIARFEQTIDLSDAETAAKLAWAA